MNVIYHSEFSSIYFEEYGSEAIIRWKPLGIIEDGDWKASFEEGLQFYARNIKKYKKISWLNDTSKLQAVGADNIKWLLEYTKALAESTGHPRLAFVKPDNPIGLSCVKLYIVSSCKLNPGVMHGLFETVDDARAWLKEEAFKNLLKNKP